MKEARSQFRAEAVIAMILRPSRFLRRTAVVAAIDPCARGTDATAVRRGRQSDAAAVPGIPGIEPAEMAAVADAVAMMTMERMVMVTDAGATKHMDAAAANETRTRTNK